MVESVEQTGQWRPSLKSLVGLPPSESIFYEKWPLVLKWKVLHSCQLFMKTFSHHVSKYFLFSEWFSKIPCANWCTNLAAGFLVDENLQFCRWCRVLIGSTSWTFSGLMHDAGWPDDLVPRIPYQPNELRIQEKESIWQVVTRLSNSWRRSEISNVFIETFTFRQNLFALKRRQNVKYRTQNSKNPKRLKPTVDQLFKFSVPLLWSWRKDQKIQELGELRH